MLANDLKLLNLVNDTIDESSEEFSIPLDISDIINICQEYNKLGSQIQKQVEFILDLGVDESIKSGYVKYESLPHIKNFLNRICDNAYFGDAVNQSKSCIYLIDEYQERQRVKLVVNYN
jgi:hypothetical protein